MKWLQNSIFWNFQRLSVRRIVRDWRFSIINILGLAIGLSVFLFIVEYVQYESNYDRSEISEQVFRVQNNYIRHGELIYNTAATFPGVGPNMKDYFPEVVSFARYYPWSKLVRCNIVIQGLDEKKFFEKNVGYADQELLSLIPFEFVSSNLYPLMDPGQVIISESAALKYFGKEPAIGKVLELEDHVQSRGELMISGVFKDLPSQTHFSADVIISYSTLYNRGTYRGNPAMDGYEQDMGDYHFYTYILLGNSEQIVSISAKMDQFLDHFKPRYKEANDQGIRMRTNEFTFTNIADIHLDSDLQFEAGINGNRNEVVLLSIVSVFVLVLAWVNYINLYTARALERIKEVGIRKVIGSSQKTLFAQFMVDAGLFNLISLILSITLIQLFQPLYNDMVGIQLSLWTLPPVILLILLTGTLIAGTLISGVYPALSNARRPILLSLQNSDGTSSGGNVRRVLIIFQFFVSVGLMISTAGVYQQMEFMNNSDKGFSSEQVIVIQKAASPDSTMGKRGINFKEALKKLSSVRSVAGSDVIPGMGIVRGLAISRTRASEENVQSIEELTVDPDFFECYGFEKVFDIEIPHPISQDTTFIVLNESAVASLGYQDVDEALNDYVYLFTERPAKIVNIIKDYHHESFHYKVDPMFYWLNPDVDNLISIKIQGDVNHALSEIQKLYQDYYPGDSFDYEFISESFQQQYIRDIQFSKTFNLFSILAIIIACMGLLGLAIFTISKRKKEIGIRKVLGAGTFQIVAMVSKEIMVLILIAAAIASPVSFVWLNQWLMEFAFRTSLTPLTFFVPMVIAGILAFLSILYQVINITRINPTETLRNE